MKKILTILLLTTFVVNAQNNVQWADKVLFTDGLDSVEIGNYNQILGYPNAQEGLSDKACTFKKLGSAIQTTRVAFSFPTETKQLIIAQNYFSGAIKEVKIFDSSGNKRQIYTHEPKAIVKDNYSRFLGIETPKGFKIKEVEIVLNLDYLESNFCQIDGIGLLNNSEIDMDASYWYLVSILTPNLQKLTFRSPFLGLKPDSTKMHYTEFKISEEVLYFANKFKIQWAEKDAIASSEVGCLAKNALGKPTFIHFYDIREAWKPQLHRVNEWIEVGYKMPQTVSDILVFKNADTKYGFEKIELLDSTGLVQDKFSWFDKRATLRGPKTLWHLQLEEPTAYKVAAIKIYINTLLYEYVTVGTEKKYFTIQIDAIGISNEGNSINELVLNGEKVEKENLGKIINSEAIEVSPLVTYDGKQLFFVRDRHPKNTGMYKSQDAWVATWGKNKWQQPVNLGKPINTQENNAISAISPNGKTLYLLNTYMPNGSLRSGFSTSKLRNGIWSFPKELKINDRAPKFYSTEFAVAPNRKVLVMSAYIDNNYKNYDLYVSFLNPDSTWTKPTNIGETINTNFSEGSPFIAADNRTLYFSSRGHLGYGDADIFMSQRLDETWTNWSEPINLGNEINTPQWNGYFSVIASGENAYTCTETKSLNKEDIFRVNLPTNAKPKPVIILKGIIEGQNIQRIEAIEADNTKESYLADFDEETNEYILILPANKKYNLNIIHERNTNYQSLVDLTTYKVYTEIKKDINLNE